MKEHLPTWTSFYNSVNCHDPVSGIVGNVTTETVKQELGAGVKHLQDGGVATDGDSGAGIRGAVSDDVTHVADVDAQEVGYLDVGVLRPRR